MSTRRRAVRRDAFTRTDLLGIVVLLVVLIGLLLPAIPTARVRHTNITSANNLRQMALAMNTAALNYNELPPTIGQYPKAGNVNGTVFFHLLPFMEEENIYNFVVGTGAAYGTAMLQTNVKTFEARLDPSNTGDGLTSYAANGLVFGTGGNNVPAVFNTKGTSNTIVFMERFAVVNPVVSQNLSVAGNVPAALVFPYPAIPQPDTAVATSQLDYRHFWGFSDFAGGSSYSNCALPLGNQGYPRPANTVSPVPATVPSVAGQPAVAGNGAVYPNTATDTAAAGGPARSNLPAATAWLGPYTPAEGGPVAGYQSVFPPVPPPQFGAAAGVALNDTPHAFTRAGCQVAMGDAGVRTVSPRVSISTWGLAVDPRANGTPGPDW